MKKYLFIIGFLIIFFNLTYSQQFTYLEGKLTHWYGSICGHIFGINGTHVESDVINLQSFLDEYVRAYGYYRQVLLCVYFYIVDIQIIPEATISGYVKTREGMGLSGVVMNGLPGNPITNSSGYYSASVSYGWSGIVTPQKSGYKFDPSSQSYSNVTSDQTQNYTGTFENNALHFDGGDFVEILESSKLNSLLYNRLTIEAWIKPKSDYGVILSRYIHNDWSINNDSFHLGIKNNKLLFEICCENGNFASVTNFRDLWHNEWIHVAAVYNGNYIKNYVNGTGSWPVYIEGNINQNNTTLFIGRESGSEWLDYPRFYGAIDEVRIWETERTKDQIVENMYKTLNGTEPGLISYWKFDEGYGQKVHNSVFPPWLYEGQLGSSPSIDGNDPEWMYPGSPVPVELASFSAEISNFNKIILKWSTLTETNNLGFEIERSIDGEIFSRIGFVEGNGTTMKQRDYQFIDDKIEISGNIYYRLKQIDFDGSFEYSEAIKVEISIPNEFKLFQNYPNPFNPYTTIKYEIPKTTNVTLKIYNLLGQEIKTLINQEQQPGNYKIIWDGTNNYNIRVSSRLYIYQIRSGSYIKAKKMVLLK